MIDVTTSPPVATVTLDRPEVRNAFDPRLMAELGAAVGSLAADGRIRVIVLAGAGKMFSAGADLEWMRAAADYDEAANVADALRLADLLATVRDCPKPVVCRVHGAALGGGAGLVAAADIAVAAEGTRFGFTEVKLGLIPAVISPYVVPRIGLAASRELFLTGETFDATRAQSIGLVSRVVPEEILDAAVSDRVEALLAAGPDAQAAVKDLFKSVWGPPAGSRERTAEFITARRASTEGQAGMRAFLERREPPWRAGD